MISSLSSIVKGLTEQGLLFSVSEQQSSGEYASSDAEWNYKDVPHLAEVHDQAEAVSALITSNSVAAIFIQKIGPFRVPLAVFNYSIDRNINIYFTTFGPFVLLIQSEWKTISETTTVVTKYHVGSSKFLKLFHQLIHKLLERNYKVLMVADIPMRRRRGVLRSRGYSFLGDDTGHGFLETINLQIKGLVVPANLPIFQWQDKIENISQGNTLIGENDNSGLRISRTGNHFKIFPRICLHAGASLDNAKYENSCLRCPWHGKLIKPIFDFSASNLVNKITASGFELIVQDNSLKIKGILR